LKQCEQTFRQDHPKTAKSCRVVELPTFTADAVRRRLAKVGTWAWMHYCPSAGTGPPLTTANVRRQLRHVLGGAWIDVVTLHMFRRTVATAVNINASIELAAELLGRTTQVTVQHYIPRSEMVSAATAALLNRGQSLL
jgi:integrase